MKKKEALNYAYNLSSRREMCSSEIQKKLSDKNCSSEIIEVVIESLAKENFIDDERFAIAFAKDKMRFQKWGKMKISFQLRQKRITETNIQIALSEIDENEYHLMIEAELQKKFNSLKKNDLQISQKLLRFAFSRGYSFEDSDVIVRKILSADF